MGKVKMSKKLEKIKDSALYCSETQKYLKYSDKVEKWTLCDYPRVDTGRKLSRLLSNLKDVLRRYPENADYWDDVNLETLSVVRVKVVPIDTFNEAELNDKR